MKTFYRTIAVVVTALVILVGVTYPKIGDLTFQFVTTVESKLYGLERRSVAIEELEMVFYEAEHKDAETIMLIHGYTADKSAWLRFAKYLTADYHVVIPDLAGHGDTAFNSSWDFSSEKQAARILALMNAMDIHQAHIVGSSMGGTVAASFALNHPTRTSSVTLISPGGATSPEPSDSEKMLAKGINPFLIERPEDFERIYSMSMEKAPWIPGFVIDAMAQNYIDRRDNYAHIFTDIKDENFEHLLPSMQPPSFLLWGAKDRLVHVSAVDKWQSLVPNIRVELLDEIGHIPMVEAPKLSAQMYLHFLATLAPQVE